LRRGDLVTVAIPGDFGKPRPALVIQSDLFEETGTVTILMMSGTLVDAPLIRLTVQPSAQNGLLKVSQIMVDKAMSVKRDKLTPPFGCLDDEIMLSVTRSLAVFLGIA
jgi:mRNA interferase MazF